MPATLPGTADPTKALKDASRSAATALRSAAAQLAVAERTVADTARALRGVSPSPGSRLLKTARDLQTVREIVLGLRDEVRALQAGPATRRSTAGVRRPAVSRAGNPPLAPSAAFDALLHEGALLDSAAFLERAGFTRQALSKAVLANRLFYVEVGPRRGYPAFYADPALQRKQIEAVCKLLGDLSGASKWLFFITPKGSLAGQESGEARTPLQALRAGEFAKVKTAAAGFAQR